MGTSETISQGASLFAQVDRKARIYKAKAAGAVPAGMANQAALAAEFASTGGAARVEPGRKVSMRELADRVLADVYVPASVLIDEAFEVLYLHGRTGPYLEPAAGEPSMNLLRMAREGLRLELATAVRRAKAEKRTVRTDGVRFKTSPGGAAGSGATSAVNLIVHPVKRPDAAGHLLAVIFEDVTVAANPDDETAAAPVDQQEPSMMALERELRSKEEYLQTVVEELETTNEEFKSTNEELQSSNEELQSANEELSTSREEMQSINEELSTVNTELQSKIEQVSRANSDLSNLMASTDIATLFVDHQLNIQRFTPATSRVINLIQTDVGRPVSDIMSRLKSYERLVPDVQEVLDTLIPKEVVVQHQDGDWYQIRIQPYRTIENVIEGAVITFVDVTSQKRLQLALQDSQERLALLFEALPVGVSVLNAEDRIVYVNPALETILGFTREELLRGDHTRSAFRKPDGSRMLPQELVSVRAAREQRAISHAETGIIHRDGRVVWTDLSVVPVELPDWKLIVVTFDLSAARSVANDERAADQGIDDMGRTR